MNSDDRNEIMMMAVSGVLLNGYSKSFRDEFSDNSQTERFNNYWMIINDASAEIGLSKTKEIMKIFSKAVDDANLVLKGSQLFGHQICEVKNG